MKKLSSILFFLLALPLMAEQYDFKPNNPISTEWLKEHLQADSPRIILDDEKLASMKAALARNDEAVTLYYALIKKDADQLCDGIPPLERKKIGKRLLQTSRKALNRTSGLALVANIEADNQKYVQRLNEELQSLCAFSDWNPSHFLDVAEMALAVSIGIDWCHDSLPPETMAMAKTALIEKALIPGNKRPFFAKVSNNWNQVCNGGLTAAAITAGEEDPELAEATIFTALNGLPNALKSYYPNGLYPEGVSYWIYGTYYSAFMVDMCRSAFGTDFNLSKSPGFQKSALYARLMVAPSGKTYNFFDCSNTVSPMRYQPLLAWFSPEYYSPDALINKLKTAGHTSWFEPLGLLWVCDLKDVEQSDLPEKWIGRGHNPVAILRNNDDPRGFYFGCKGGKASLSHGNMDAGSFVYELDGIRWSVDLGMQSYTALEKAIGNRGLWNSKQDSARWTLLSKNNSGHSTITVNEEQHIATAHSNLTEQDESICIDLSKQFGSNVSSAQRKIAREGRYGIQIQDIIVPNENTKKVTWSMMTQADVKIDGSILHLTQQGKSIDINISQPASPTIEIISLDPPPLPHDMKIKNLKRIDIIQTENFSDVLITISP